MSDITGLSAYYQPRELGKSQAATQTTRVAMTRHI